jgi:hypothetical protein
MIDEVESIWKEAGRGLMRGNFASLGVTKESHEDTLNSEDPIQDLNYVRGVTALPACSVQSVFFTNN